MRSCAACTALSEGTDGPGQRNHQLIARRSTLARSANHDWPADGSVRRLPVQARERPSPVTSRRCNLELLDLAKRLRDGDAEARLLLTAAETGAIELHARPNVELTGARQQGSPADGRSIDQLRLAAGLTCCCASG